MGPLQLLLICILSLSSVVFIALFGRLPTFRRTPIGFLHRLLLLHIPRLLFKLDQLTTNGRLTHAFKHTNHYLVFERHPIILIFFLILLVGSEMLFIPPAWSQISSLHHLLMPVLVSLPYLLLYLGYNAQSLINHTNHAAQMRHYPYDRTLYHPGAICHTCQLPKPARSKHCSLCNACVSKMDHHCIWLNACVGRRNYIHFLLLLLSTSALLFYGAFLGWSILSSLSPRPLRPTTALTQPHFWNTLSSLLAYHSRLGAVTLLTTLSSPLPTGLLVYHIYLLWAGMTTNESEKWGDLRDDVAAGIVWQASRTALMDDYPPLPPHVEPPLAEVAWPIEAKWWVCRMRPGERPQRWVKGESEGEMVPGEVDERWERVDSLKDVVNVYDLGFWENLVDCVWNRD